MRVIICIALPSIEDPTSQEADEVIDAMHLDALRLKEQWSGGYPDVNVWVNEVIVESEAP